MKYFTVTFLSVLQMLSNLYAQPYATWNDTALTLNNGIVKRIIRLPASNGHFITTTYQPVQGDFQYFTNSNTDFQFEINGKVYSANDREVKFEFIQ